MELNLLKGDKIVALRLGLLTFPSPFYIKKRQICKSN
jgi:hypothetical protein